MKVATTRFAVRAKRPNVEQTRDYVHGGLLSEINDISGSQEALKVCFREFSFYLLSSPFGYFFSIRRDLKCVYNNKTGYW